MMTKRTLLSALLLAIGLTLSAQKGRYADHSVLAEGRWVKISVPETGIYQLSDSLLLAAGFADPDQVKVYGYGGALQPEKLSGDYLQATDDLKEVPTCVVKGRRLFHAVGPVNWTSGSDPLRVRNHYSDYGYYFLTTNGDEAPQQVDSQTFSADIYPGPEYYHRLVEADEFAWYHGGRNLYAKEPMGIGQRHVYTYPAVSRMGKLTVAMSYAGFCDATVRVNDSLVGHILIDSATTSAPLYRPKVDEYSKATQYEWTFNMRNLRSDVNTLVIEQQSGAEMRLDYLVMTDTSPRPFESLATSEFPQPAIVGEVPNQDLHADPQADMVIIVPTSGMFLPEALRLKQLHEDVDGMRVNVVKAGDLYNEFSSGTPDANAYRRYLKMLYDRAKTDEDKPRFLVLFGDGAWDNRMLTPDWSSTSPDDFLLCYESVNSFSTTECYVTDDFFCVLDDGDGGDLLRTDKIDVAVGRLPVRTPEEAKVVVDKIAYYRQNDYPGAWQNTICLMGDDGNANLHMLDAEEVYKVIMADHDALNIKKIYWDAYPRTSSSTGDSYPDVTRLIRQQMQTGALIMNYSGHGSPYCLSHEQVVYRSDFAAPAQSHLPLWVTASCDVVPFDTQEPNIGKDAMLNPTGGAIAFLGTARTVYAQHNRPLNKAFIKYALGYDDNGQRYTLGQALSKAKNEQTRTSANRQAAINKLHFSLLGDPALVLATPTMRVVIDSIDGHPVDEGQQRLQAGKAATVVGHVVDAPDFEGVATLTVLDVEETIVCMLNPQPAAEMPSAPLRYQTRPNTIYVGTDSVHAGRFSFTFAVPKDISYSDDTGQMLVYAVSNDKTQVAHGVNTDFSMGSADSYADDPEGPQMVCYLNSRMFKDGGKTNDTPYFYAELYDEDGIYAAGSGIGHDMELIIDGEMGRTYNLNDYFVYDFGDYRRGVAGFSIPHLPDGPHRLLFRAWDVLNHSSVFELSFVVDANLDLAGIRDVLNDQTLSRYRQRSEGTLYDASGRQLFSCSTAALSTQLKGLPSGLYIFRSATGVTKKILVKGNK